MGKFGFVLPRACFGAASLYRILFENIDGSRHFANFVLTFSKWYFDIHIAFSQSTHRFRHIGDWPGCQAFE